MREAIGRYGIKEAMLKYPNWNWDSQSINQVLDPQPVSEQQFFLGADLRREERLQKKRNFEILVFVTVAVYATAALFLCFAPPTRMNVGLMGLLLAPTLLLLLGLGIISYVQSRPSSGIAKARRGGAAYVFVFLIIPFLLAEMFGAFAILQGRGHPEESFFYSWFRKADIEWRCVSCGKRFLVGTSTISATCPYCHASNTSVGNR